MEIWKDVKDFEGVYQVSNLGNVKSLDRVTKDKNGVCYKRESRLLKPTITDHGYLTVDLRKDGTRKTTPVHRLVAIAFIDNPDEKPEVNHKDGKKINNRVDNLEWATRSENIMHAISTGLNKRSEKSGRPKKSVVQIQDGMIVRTFDSIGEAARITGITRENIQQVVKGKRKRSGGYHWKYA